MPPENAWGGRESRAALGLCVKPSWYENADLLRMATGTNGELVALSGPRNPYPGKLGIIEEGAFADLLVIDGDPIANIALVENPENNFMIIMKDGKIYKNTLHSKLKLLGLAPDARQREPRRPRGCRGDGPERG